MPAVASSVQRNSPRLNTITQENRAGVTAASLIPALPQSGADQLEEVRQLARLKALPILSILSDRERAGLLKQLRNASPSERLASINQYPRLASISEQQKQAVLNEIEKAVPVNISASQLICSCSNDIKREMCVRERCSNLSEMQSLCNQACGTLAAFKSECSASSKCAGK
jgi:hypothetical protein